MKNQLIEKFKDQYMELDKWYTTSWHYVQFCILKSYMDDYKVSHHQPYYDFVKNYIELLFDENGNIPKINLNYYSIDEIRMASILFDLYDQEKDPKYKKVMDSLYHQLTTTYPRTPSNNFWHKENYPNQVWLDGLYMGQPFYVEYIKRFNETKHYEDTLNQFKNVRKRAFDESKKLYYHAYDESKKMFWCNPENGLSPHVWLRAVGWLMMAFVDILELLEGEPADAQFLKDYLKETLDGMLPYQDQTTGMWYQVVDFPGRENNYLETSGTSMMVYAILKGIRKGYLDPSYQDVATKAFNGMVNQYLTERDGVVYLGGICKSAGLGKNPGTGVVRDGSYAYYTTGELKVENNGHGVAAFFMAYNEIKLLK